MSKIWTLAKNENSLDQMRVFLYNMIITKIKHFGDLYVIVDVCLQANDYSQLIKILTLPLFPMTRAKLNEFGLRIDRENILYWSAIFFIGIICTIPNMPAASSVQKTLKLGNNSPATPTLNSKKQARAAFDFSSSFYLFFLCISQIKKLKAAFARAGKTTTTKNLFFSYE